MKIRQSRPIAPVYSGPGLDEPWWWNGRHEGLKSLCPQGRESSTLSRGTAQSAT